MVWVVTVVLLFYSCSMHHFFPILRVPKDPQATPWEATAWKDKVENLCFGAHSLEFLGSTGKPGGGKSRILVSLPKELSCCDSKGFSSSRSRQVWSCCAVSSQCSQGRVSRAANAPSALQGKDRAANRLSPTKSQQDQLYRLVHHSPVFPQGMGGNKVQGCGISKVTLPLSFWFFSRRMDSLKGVNMLLKPSCLAPSAHSFWQSLVLCTLCVYCATLSPHFPRKSRSLNHWGKVFLVRLSYMMTTQLGNAGIWDSWKDPAERSPGCTVLSISLPPPGFGREQIPSRIIGLRSWKVIQILH